LPEPTVLQADFDRLAPAYEEHAALEREVCARLAERSSFSKREPQRILDIGSRTGVGAELLKRTFKRAQVVGMDISPAMLCLLARKSRFRRPLGAVCGELRALPFRDGCADFVFSNLALHWLPRPAVLFEEVRRVLRTGGMFLFSTLGPSSLSELRAAGSGGPAALAIPEFADLLEIGDALMAAGFSEPVMDMERIVLDYPSLDALAGEVEAVGTSLLIGGWPEWRRHARAAESAFGPLKSGDRYPLSYEVLYGTAFGPPEGQPRRTARGDEARISVDSLLKSRRMG
jgi:malonyl-CoA O-methyltransferase